MTNTSVKICSVFVPEVSLFCVSLNAESSGTVTPPYEDAGNILLEGYGSLLTEDNGAFLLETKVKQINIS